MTTSSFDASVMKQSTKSAPSSPMMIGVRRAHSSISGNMHYRDELIGQSSTDTRASSVDDKTRSAPLLGLQECCDEDTDDDEPGMELVYATGAEGHTALFHEAEILALCKHTHVIKMHGVSFSSPDADASVTLEVSLELMSTTVEDRLGQLSLDKILKTGLDVLNGLSHIHSCNVVHRDIKPANILLSSATRMAKIGRFSVAVRMHSDSTGQVCMDKQSSKMEGTWAFMAPECFDDTSPVTAKVDVYSFAILMWEMLTGKFAWDGYTYHQIVYQVMQGNRPPLPDHNHFGMPALNKLIAECWLQQPEDRPTSAQAESRLWCLITSRYI